jgi:hypothetical protein
MTYLFTVWSRCVAHFRNVYGYVDMPEPVHLLVSEPGRATESVVGVRALSKALVQQAITKRNWFCRDVKEWFSSQVSAQRTGANLGHRATQPTQRKPRCVGHGGRLRDVRRGRVRSDRAARGECLAVVRVTETFAGSFDCAGTSRCELPAPLRMTGRKDDRQKR